MCTRVKPLRADWSTIYIYNMKKESIIHILYECKRVKEIWKIICHCLNMFIQPKHILLGITDPHYVELNRHLCIVFIYLGFYVAFNTVQVISRRIVGRAEETST